MAIEAEKQLRELLAEARPGFPAPLKMIKQDGVILREQRRKGATESPDRTFYLEAMIPFYAAIPEDGSRHIRTRFYEGLRDLRKLIEHVTDKYSGGIPVEESEI